MYVYHTRLTSVIIIVYVYRGIVLHLYTCTRVHTIREADNIPLHYLYTQLSCTIQLADIITINYSTDQAHTVMTTVHVYMYKFHTIVSHVPVTVSR